LDLVALPCKQNRHMLGLDQFTRRGLSLHSGKVGCGRFSIKGHIIKTIQDKQIGSDQAVLAEHFNFSQKQTLSGVVRTNEDRDRWLQFKDKLGLAWGGCYEAECGNHR
jgi:hypothetical protein